MIRISLIARDSSVSSNQRPTVDVTERIVETTGFSDS